MQKNKVRIGIVGSGYAAGFHTDAYRKVTSVDAQVVGVYSRNAQNRSSFAAAKGIPNTFSSLEAMLASPDIDIIDICTPNSSHDTIAIAAAQAGKHVVVEKILTGYFGRGEQQVGATDRTVMLEHVASSTNAIKAAIDAAGVQLCYAENWVYAPSIQKANQLLTNSNSTILRLTGEESHGGSHSPFAKEWRTAGGGSLVNKGSHPLGAVLFLKYEEGQRRHGKPIRAKRVSAHVGNLTRIPSFVAEEEKWIKTGWVDVEDWGIILIEFSDGSVAQITGADTALGGIQNTLAIYASKAVIQCNLNPNNAMLTYAPDNTVFGDEYIREKVETKAGWQFVSPDEAFAQGYYHEMENFCQAVSEQRPPVSGLLLGSDVAIVLYAAYLAAEKGCWVDVTPYLS